MVQVSIVIPTYNERKNLAVLVQRIDRVLKGHEIIIVDDHSPDGTGRRAEQLAARYPVRCIHRREKEGLGSAVIAGCGQAQGKHIVVMDADLSHPPELIPRLVDALRESDLAIASRYCAGGGVRNWPLARRAISGGARLLCRPLAAAHGVHDPLSGFFAMRRSVIAGIRLQVAGFKILLEILARGRVRRIAEIPYMFTDRRQGSSKLGVHEAFRYMKQLAQLYRARLTALFLS
ncbi:MAG TPA: polyprenol monophosphomannose synthase [Candidatus Nanoarchaeia archaeon]|nr:polyprenol monophosphomannose synthase [Candidatus Nanoarchaeia archaeon]